MENTSSSQNTSDVQIVDFPHFTSIEDCQERCGISNTDWCESIISFTRYETSFYKSRNLLWLISVAHFPEFEFPVGKREKSLLRKFLLIL